MSNTAILALGKNWELPIPKDQADLKISIESDMTVEAGGTLLNSGIGDLIIFSGGHTAGQENPTEASKMSEAMYSYANLSNIPKSKVVLEEESYDTSSSLLSTQRLMSKLAIDSVVLLTIGYHLPRVERLARILGIAVSGAYKSDYVIRESHGGAKHLCAREVLANSVHRHSIRPLLRTSASYGLEVAGWGLSFIDPEGKNIAGLLTSKVRHYGHK